MHVGISSLLAVLMTTYFPAVAAQGHGSEGESVVNDVQVSKLRLEALAYEHGEGVPRNPTLAATLYCQGARQGDAEAQYNLGWMYANGRGVERSDSIAAFFFHAAAEQGLEAAQRMLKVVGAPTGESPDCMRDPAPELTTPSQPSVDYSAIAPRKIFDLVMKISPQYHVEPQLVLAIIAAESNFNSLALSPKNAQGLMQLIPQTSLRFNVKNPYDPAQNIRGGLTYLRWLLAYFEGDVALVAAAYNAGEGKVERYRGVPPYLETRAYVQRILKSVGTATHPFDETVARPSPSLPLIRLSSRGKSKVVPENLNKAISAAPPKQ
ncbi:Sel1 repeat-containing protein [Polaromonas sp. OV174]|uniref:transglycosylase SLT domain-containing protein n=1 Tax=Polaromonas sp. OV174 TaxID=1855300 RepID=UPI0008E055A2|nr:transglycosylase SLT domain-containing protein [Polaromonas sp. OV174]SFC24241.1 Sel1 repeat-containing protein [Polaromonas sp. OV174]